MQPVVYKPAVGQIAKSGVVINSTKAIKANQPSSALPPPPHAKMKPIIYKRGVEITELNNLIINLTVDDENEMSKAKQKSKEIVNLKDSKQAKKSEDIIDLTNGDLSSSWSTADEADVTVPRKVAVETNPFKIKVPKVSPNNPFKIEINPLIGNQGTKTVSKKKTEDKSEKENIPANNNHDPPAGSKVVLNPLSIRMKRHREYALFETAMDGVRKENKIPIDKTPLSDYYQQIKHSTNYGAKILNLDDYLTRPMSIPYPITVDSRRFFEVKILEISSPSQFMFQFNSDQLQFMMDEMK